MNHIPEGVETALGRMLTREPIPAGSPGNPHPLVTSHGHDGPFTEVADGDVEMGLHHADGREVPRLRLRNDLVSVVLEVWRSDLTIPFQLDHDEVVSLRRSLSGTYSDVHNPGPDLEYALWIQDLCEQALIEGESVYFRPTGTTANG